MSSECDLAARVFIGDYLAPTLLDAQVAEATASTDVPPAVSVGADPKATRESSRGDGAVTRSMKNFAGCAKAHGAGPWPNCAQGPALLSVT